jgi:hypothetical protein
MRISTRSSWCDHIDTATSITGQGRKGTMLRQCSPRNILRRTGLCLLAVVLLASGGVPKVHAQTNRYAEDAARLAAIAKWVSGTWKYIGGLRTAIGFLTGFDGQAQLTLADIRETVVSAIKEVNAETLAKEVDGFADNFHQVQVLTRSVASDAMRAGQSMDSIMVSDFGKIYLAARFSELINSGTYLFKQLDPILRAGSIDENGRSNSENDRLVIAVTPAYTVLVPLLVSAMKLVGEIDPALKSGHDELISEKLASAQQTLFMAAGAYTLYAYEPGPNPPNYFYSPVAEDSRWMWKWPLYAYHYRDPYIGGRFYGPAEPFHRYQTIPIVKLALDSLQEIMNVQPSMVWAENAVIWDLYTEKFAPFVFGWIIRLRQ